MDLTLNEMRALRKFAEAALREDGLTLRFEAVPDASCRKSLLERYLKDAGLGHPLNTGWHFAEAYQAVSLVRRLADLIEDEERRRRDASRTTQAAWLAALAAVVSAAAALASLLF